MKPVIIVGGGWAGLAAACELAGAGVPVHLLESSPQLGGRARTVQLDGINIDNGQHLLIGAYRETLRLLHRIGVDAATVLRREPLSLNVQRDHALLQLTAPPLPAPLHLAWALWQGLRGPERRAALAFCLTAWRRRFRIAQDISVAELLGGQPEGLVRALWEPLCLATLNTPLAQASAQVFLHVLHDAFTRRRHDADLLHPRTDLGQVLPQPAQRYIERHGGRVDTRRRAQALHLATDGPTVVTAAGMQAASHVIVATAPWHAAPLLATHSVLQPLAQQLRSLGDAPITTVYLSYPAGITLGRSMLGFAGGTVQWLIDRGIVCGQPGLLAAVISGPGEHAVMDSTTQGAQVAAEIAQRFPQWPAPQRIRVVRERRATFLCDVGSNARRPPNATPVPGLWLAGDYTASGYPATLEGAVRSGVQCAQQIIDLLR
ncbi:hydroxysqualene dehydroxylase HpnE [Sulfurivermis fontis]|uniref:hydroxysqualene dehydroxylase HpnE n=1 Tax=Sulfurivermis fontis TaxID=1972068 RepID=UPI000FD99EBE|nr:hydroxysqualene dehydroxylase HpnE [Sulfurivermis fontis]